jgi:serine/threonine-protein kinase
MALTIGTQLGSHEIIALLGKGGMGEVYRARDLKLKREVAIKILPDEFSRDADRVSRFQREAEVLASLNHPNIATIYDLEEANGSRFLVLELVEGETLADRIARGPIPVDKALAIAKQICEALEAAHEKGIIHRDLKPANVKITPDGKVKVLDFGLAKAMENTPVNSTLSNSPTMLSGTIGGMIVGTAPYMPPEQVRGRPADQRGDVFAFGCVLYEMLTGRQAFAGDHVSDVLASILKTDVDFSILPQGAPHRLRVLLQRCLEKDPRRRWYAIGDVRIEMETMADATEGRVVAVSRRSFAKSPIGLMFAVIFATGLAVAGLRLWRSASPESSWSVRLSTQLGADATLFTEHGPSAILAGDGKTLAFVATPSGSVVRQLFVRPLDKLDAKPLAGTENARTPFFSPNGEWIGFFADGKLKKISTTGGTPLEITATFDERGAWWSEDDKVYWSTGGPGSVIRRIPASGGTRENVTTLDDASHEVNHRLPQTLPGDRGVLFIMNSSVDAIPSLMVQRFPKGERKVLRRGASYGRYLPNGYLVYVQDATVFAAVFDLDRLEIRGEPLPVIEGVADAGYNGAHFSFADDGSFIYLPGRAIVPSYNLTWLNSNSKTETIGSHPGEYGGIRFSPDGQRLLLDFAKAGTGVDLNLWLYESTRDVMFPLTSDPVENREAIWSPDGRYIAFASARANGVTRNIYLQRSDGSGTVQRLTESKTNEFPKTWHPRGEFLAFSEFASPRKIMILPMEGNDTSGWKAGKPYPLDDTPFDENDPAFSPDGRWIAYQLVTNGKEEVYVQPFPKKEGKWQVSTTGGRFPTWSRNRNELYFLGEDQKLWVVTYTASDGGFHPSKPRLWSDVTLAQRSAPIERSFDLHPDGNRFVILQPAPDNNKRDHLVFISNFGEDLRQRVGVKH